MKKLIALLMAVAMIFALCACGETAAPAAEETAPAAEEAASAAEEAAPAAEEKTYTIAVAYSVYDEYHVEWEKYALAWLKEHYGDRVKIISTVAESDAAKQQSDIESLIVQQPDCIMVWAVDSEGSIPAVESIQAAGIKCIVNSYAVNTDKYDLFLYADQILTGSMQAEYCKEWIANHPGEKLNCCYLWGVTGISGCIDRFDGWKNNCVDGENIVLLDEQIGNWDTAEAMAVTEDWIQGYPEMNCIVCMSDEMALGVIQALQGAGKNLDDYVVLGIDGSESAQLELDKGTLDGTVFENRRLAAEIHMDYTMRLLEGEEFENKDILIVCKQMMTPDNKAEILASLE